MLEEILINLNIPKNIWHLYSIDKVGGLVNPSPDILFKEGFIKEDEFLYKQWLVNTI